MCCRQSSKGAQKKPAIQIARGQLLSVLVWLFEGMPQLLFLYCHKEVMAPAFMAGRLYDSSRPLSRNNHLYFNEIGC